MHILKRILEYIIWGSISFLSAFGYILLLLGSKPDSSEGFLEFLGLLIYYTAIAKLVPIIGSIIAILYIVLDIFYLKRRLENNPKRILIRFIIIIVITCVVAVTHYVLEKVIDII